MGCKYWECKFNNLTQKGMTDCGKPNGSNIKHPCPKQNGDFCSDGEVRDTEDIAELNNRK